jgi:hypothetical protein
VKFFQILKESRADEFTLKYANKFTGEQLRRMIDLIKPKFLDWSGRVLDAISFEKQILQLNEYLNIFENISSNLPQTDINRYKSLDELIQEIKKYQDKPKRNYTQTEGGNLVFQDDRFYIINPLNHKSSCYYGAGTKWCTSTTDSDANFNKYNSDGKLFYFIDKKLKTDDPFYKVALLYKFDKEKSWWDAQDNSFSKGWILGSEELDKIMGQIEEYLRNQYPEQIQKFEDEKRKKEEKERQRRLEIQRIQRQRYEDAEERRAEGEWDLGPDCPEEGLKAHALLDWLVDTSDIEVLTNADRIEIQRINDEIERLNTEYDTSDEVKTDLLDTISDLEDERDELVSKIDVYNIVPTGEYYQMTEFEVIESADLEGRRYVVGTLDETRESAEEALRQQIDDMGVDAFNHGFAKGHLDKDKIEDTARDYFYQDIWDNPEAFLDDSQRELSNKQDDNINLLERKIKQAEDSIESLEELDGTEEKIEELQDMIVDWEEEIQEIKDDPQGDFPSELIDEKIDEMVEDAVSDPEYFLSNYGLDWADFIDVEALIEEAIDVDGEAHFINSYDGNSDEVTVQDQTFVVMRID